MQVIDGERGNEYRRQILPSYKANRRKFVQPLSALQTCGKSSTGKHQLITDVLRNCNVPVSQHFIIILGDCKTLFSLAALTSDFLLCMSRNLKYYR